MQHQRGDAPGPTTKQGHMPADSPPEGQPAATPVDNQHAPLSYGESPDARPGEAASAPPDKYHDPSKGEAAAPEQRGSGSLHIPSEDS